MIASCSAAFALIFCITPLHLTTPLTFYPQDHATAERVSANDDDIKATHGFLYPAQLTFESKTYSEVNPNHISKCLHISPPSPRLSASTPAATQPSKSASQPIKVIVLPVAFLHTTDIARNFHRSRPFGRLNRNPRSSRAPRHLFHSLWRQRRHASRSQCHFNYCSASYRKEFRRRVSVEGN